MQHERTPHERCLLRWHRRDCSPCHDFRRQSNCLKVSSRKLSIGSSVSADSVDRATAARPGGILNTSGIGSVAGGTNGLAPTLDHLLDLKKEVAVDNADVASCGYLTNAKVEAVLSKAKDSQSQYLLSPYGAELGRSQIAGRRLEVSNNVPSNLTKGSGTNLSAVIYGNFADLLIGTVRDAGDPCGPLHRLRQRHDRCACFAVDRHCSSPCRIVCGDAGRNRVTLLSRAEHLSSCNPWGWLRHGCPLSHFLCSTT